jgi:hypothetical protein
MVNIMDKTVDLDELAKAGLIAGADHTNHSGMDLLATIFAGQRRLMERYFEIERDNGAVVVEPHLHGELDDRDVQMRIKDLAYRMVEELSEATNCLKNKPWKNTFVETDREHFREELSDAVHFFVELLVTAGLTADDVFDLYFRKHQVNEFRQDSNY